MGGIIYSVLAGKGLRVEVKIREICMGKVLSKLRAK